MAIPILSDIIDAVGGLVSEVVVDKDKKAEINFKLAELADKAEQRVHEEVLAQLEVNKAEASHGSIFVAGWRPAVGWVCAAALAAQSIVLPLADRIFGWTMPFDTELLILTLGGMLGIGGMRSYEKTKGVSTNDFKDLPKSPVVKSEVPPVPPAPVSSPKPKRHFKI